MNINLFQNNISPGDSNKHTNKIFCSCKKKSQDMLNKFILFFVLIFMLVSKLKIEYQQKIIFRLLFLRKKRIFYRYYSIT